MHEYPNKSTSHVVHIVWVDGKGNLRRKLEIKDVRPKNVGIEENWVLM